MDIKSKRKIKLLWSVKIQHYATLIRDSTFAPRTPLRHTPLFPTSTTVVVYRENIQKNASCSRLTPVTGNDKSKMGTSVTTTAQKMSGASMNTNRRFEQSTYSKEI